MEGIGGIIWHNSRLPCAPVLPSRLYLLLIHLYMPDNHDPMMHTNRNTLL